VPSSRNIVITCMYINNCDFALCIACYNTSLLHENIQVGGRGRRRSRTRLH